MRNSVTFWVVGSESVKHIACTQPTGVRKTEQAAGRAQGSLPVLAEPTDHLPAPLGSCAPRLAGFLGPLCSLSRAPALATPPSF